MTKEYPTPEYRAELLVHKAPPMFWTWPAHTLFFGLVFFLCTGPVGMVFGLVLKAVYPFDPEFEPLWESMAWDGFEAGMERGFILAFAAAALSYLNSGEVRRLWSDYRYEGWSAGECRAMYRHARATGTGLLPAGLPRWDFRPGRAPWFRKN